MTSLERPATFRKPLPRAAAQVRAICEWRNAAAMFANLPKVGKAIIAGTMMLLAGCGVADQYSALPKVFRQPSAEPPPPEPEPDVKELIRAGADTLFTGHPSAVAVSRPRRVAGRGFDVCVKSGGARGDRWRTTAGDLACEHRARKAGRASPGHVTRPLCG